MKSVLQLPTSISSFICLVLVLSNIFIIENTQAATKNLEDGFPTQKSKSPQLLPERLETSPGESNNLQDLEPYLVLNLSDRLLYLYQAGQLQTTYPVAIGRQGWETPQGEFYIFIMEYYPTWRNPFTGEVIPPGDRNPLGVAWIGFWTNNQVQVGFHGTPHPSLIGQAVSHGCVRMHNQDIIDLYNRVSIGTKVKVVP